MPEDMEFDLAGFIALMIEGRRTLFSEDPRFVIRYEIYWRGDEYRLQVLSSLLPPELVDEVLEVE